MGTQGARKAVHKLDFQSPAWTEIMSDVTSLPSTQASAWNSNCFLSEWKIRPSFSQAGRTDALLSSNRAIRSGGEGDVSASFL